jgi:hypothetical protein
LMITWVVRGTDSGQLMLEINRYELLRMEWMAKWWNKDGQTASKLASHQNALYTLNAKT